MRRLFWPALTTALMLALTLGLGVWQLERLRWKQDMLAAIDRGEAAEAMPFDAASPPFAKVVVEGSFLPGVVRYGAEVRSDAKGPVMGSHVVAVLARRAGAPVVVDLGWAAEAWTVPLPRTPVRIEGYVRAPEHTPWLGTPDDPARHRFFALDPLGIGASLNQANVVPLTIVAMGGPDAVPTPVQTLPRPPNDHLSYAVTWFGLAAALAVIFLIHATQAMRHRPATPLRSERP